MSIIDRYKAIRNACKYPFFSLRDAVVQLEKTGKRNGFSRPACQIVIKPFGTKGECDVCVSVYYKTGDDSYQRYKSEFHIYSFTDVPEYVSDMLSKGEEAKLTFFQDDVEEFVLNKDLQVSNKNEELPSLVVMNLPKPQSAAPCEYNVVVRDYILYNRVIVNKKVGEGKDVYLTEFLTSDITGISLNEMNELAEKHEVALTIKH